MKNRKYNMTIFLVILLGVFFMMPKDVFATPSEDYCKGLVEDDKDEKYENCLYDMSKYDDATNGVIVCSTWLEVYGSGFSKAKSRYFDFLIVNKEDGTVSTSVLHNTSGINSSKYLSIDDDLSLFYDANTGLGKCPDYLYGWLYTAVGKDHFTFHTVKTRIPKDYVINSHVALPADTQLWVEYNNGKPWSYEKIEINDFENEITECDQLLGDKNDSSSLAWLINRFLLYLKIGGPIIILLLSSFDFIKAIILNDDENIKKSQKKLIIRIILAITLFLVPTILSILLDVFGFTSGNCL